MIKDLLSLFPHLEVTGHPHPRFQLGAPSPTNGRFHADGAAYDLRVCLRLTCNKGTSALQFVRGDKQEAPVLVYTLRHGEVSRHLVLKSHRGCARVLVPVHESSVCALMHVVQGYAITGNLGHGMVNQHGETVYHNVESASDVVTVMVDFKARNTCKVCSASCALGCIAAPYFCFTDDDG